MSPDALPYWWPLLALLLWLYLALVHRRERGSANTARTIFVSASRLEGMLTKSGEDRALDDDEEHHQRDDQGDERGDDGSDVHARIVACPCLNRAEIMAGIECEHSR